MGSGGVVAGEWMVVRSRGNGWGELVHRSSIIYNKNNKDIYSYIVRESELSLFLYWGRHFP